MKFTLDRMALGKAIGVLAMSWFALPVLYYMFCKKNASSASMKGTKDAAGEDVNEVADILHGERDSVRAGDGNSKNE